MNASQRDYQAAPAGPTSQTAGPIDGHARTPDAVGDARGAAPDRWASRRNACQHESILTLNFLPNTYRDRQATRKTRLWQLTVVLLFGGIIAGTALVQSGLYYAATRQSARLAGPYAQTVATMQRLVDLQEQLTLAEQTASLCVYLEHPWPRTQILRAATDPLPPSIRLERMEVLLEFPGSPAPARSKQAERNPAGEASEEETRQAGPEHDLKQIREACDEKQTVVHLSGIAHRTADLHNYLADVKKSPFVDEVELRSLESTGEPSNGSSRFAARIVLLPGFGQPNGPREAHTKPLCSYVQRTHRKETVE
jgi:hypothetical protein